MEIWKPIMDYEDRYLISNKGRVISLKGRNKYLSLKTDKDGYKEVSLFKKGEKRKYFRVHRLVAMHFLDNPNNYPIINHKDENKSNNCVENLEWCTHKYNNHYSKIYNNIIRDEKGRFTRCVV